MCLVVVVPNVETHPMNVTVNENNAAQFSCAFHKDTAPEPTVIWIFISSSGTKTLKGEPIGAGSRESVLKLSDVKRADEGAYRCVVENEFKSVKSSTAWLTVHCKEFNM